VGEPATLRTRPSPLVGEPGPRPILVWAM